jgi:hypothetical protein
MEKNNNFLTTEQLENFFKYVSIDDQVQLIIDHLDYNAVIKAVNILIDHGDIDVAKLNRR